MQSEAPRCECVPCEAERESEGSAKTIFSMNAKEENMHCTPASI